ncbi:MAG: nucleoside kinase [bacterium]|jgi:uridine kinase
MTEDTAGIRLRLPGGQTKEYAAGTTLLAVSREYADRYPYPIVAALLDNVVTGLLEVPESGARVEFIHLGTEAGRKIYARSLSYVFIRAAQELYPNCEVRVEHSLGKGLYCEIHYGQSHSGADAPLLEERMRAIVRDDEPFVRRTVAWEEAIRLYSERGREDMVRLFSYRKGENVDLYSCGPALEHFYECMVPSTGFIDKFFVQDYPPGFVLRFPSVENPLVVPPFVPQIQLAEIFLEAEQWAEILEVEDAGSLNGLIAAGQGGELVRIGEALHEKRIAAIADRISAHKGELRVVTVAGPSSSGKTTFAQRLSVQMKVNGLRPVAISVDDYFVNREQTPRDENGDYDFEAIEAIDLELFNDHLARLMRGEEVEIPAFNFATGEREYRGHNLAVKRDQIIIIEGIHGLNERLTVAVPKENKFKIYVSALTQLNIDRYNRIPTTDARIIRRIVRDSLFRSHDALQTIRLWNSVRRGEEKNIFPFQEEADVMFNSALVYELAVLKKFAAPLLAAVSPREPEYAEAIRLLHFLGYFLSMDDSEVTQNSILREFIGGSCFVRM